MATYEWAVLRVVPRVDRGEYVNVGVVVYCQALDFLRAAVTTDLSRALALDAVLEAGIGCIHAGCAAAVVGARGKDVYAAVRAHLESVAALCAGDLAAGDSGRRSPGEWFRWLIAPRSTVVQTSPVHTGITDDPAAELADLMARMVSTPPPEGSGR